MYGWIIAKRLLLELYHVAAVVLQPKINLWYMVDGKWWMVDGEWCNHHHSYQHVQFVLVTHV